VKRLAFWLFLVALIAGAFWVLLPSVGEPHSGVSHVKVDASVSSPMASDLDSRVPASVERETAVGRLVLVNAVSMAPIRLCRGSLGDGAALRTFISDDDGSISSTDQVPCWLHVDGFYSQRLSRGIGVVHLSPSRPVLGQVVGWSLPFESVEVFVAPVTPSDGLSVADSIAISPFGAFLFMPRVACDHRLELMLKVGSHADKPGVLAEAVWRPGQESVALVVKAANGDRRTRVHLEVRSSPLVLDAVRMHRLMIEQAGVDVDPNLLNARVYLRGSDGRREFVGAHDLAREVTEMDVEVVSGVFEFTSNVAGSRFSSGLCSCVGETVKCSFVIDGVSHVEVSLVGWGEAGPIGPSVGVIADIHGRVVTNLATFAAADARTLKSWMVSIREGTVWCEESDSKLASHPLAFKTSVGGQVGLTAQLVPGGNILVHFDHFLDRLRVLRVVHVVSGAVLQLEGPWKQPRAATRMVPFGLWRIEAQLIDGTLLREDVDFQVDRQVVKFVSDK
jgi:hypothetical protein